jgi:elongation factor P--beta-lysine ligase
MSPGSKNSHPGSGLPRLVAKEFSLRLRAAIIQALRRFFIERGYLEIETPSLIRSPAPESHIDAVGTAGGFLQTSPELCMKRLLSAGYSRIFQICKCFMLSPVSLEEALESDRFDEIMVLEVEPRLSLAVPAFLYDYPASLAVIARFKQGDPFLAERFELYMGGLELANACSELTDLDEQERRFRKEEEKRMRMGKDVYPFPERFMRDLAKMPEAAGIAFGVDRLVMLFADKETIDDVISFTPEEL